MGRLGKKVLIELRFDTIHNHHIQLANQRRPNIARWRGIQPNLAAVCARTLRKFQIDRLGNFILQQKQAGLCVKRHLRRVNPQIGFRDDHRAVFPARLQNCHAHPTGPRILLQLRQIQASLLQNTQ